MSMLRRLLGLPAVGIIAGGLVAFIPAGDLSTTASGLHTEAFIDVVDGLPTTLYRLANASGMEVCITNYGARIVSIVVPDRHGTLADVVCGFECVQDYRKIRQNFGSTVGRYIGRISGARFTIDGIEYRLQAGGGGHISHGGSPGFADRVWECVRCDGCSLVLVYRSPDGENGFPGDLRMQVTFGVRDDNTLTIDYEATTDRPTVLNPSNHSFFNISGDLSADILAQQLQIAGDSITEYDARKCVTGRMLPVANTAFDFREFRQIGDRIDDPDPQLAVTGGYDHAWAIDGWDGSLRRAARLIDDVSGRTLDVYTTEPAVHVYTANGHKGNIVGKQGIVYPKRNSICFETMHFADSPNHPQFPSTVLRPGETFRSTTEFRFGIANEFLVNTVQSF